MAQPWLLGVFCLALLLIPLTNSQSNPILVPLSWETEDYEYVADFGIGTPPKLFRLIIDTGSANLWVPSSSCTSAACTQRAQFNPSASKTAKVIGTVVPIKYGTSQILSTLVSDVVSLPQAGSGSSSQSYRQTFGIATALLVANVSGSTQQPWDGLMGMGQQALAAGNAQVPVLAMWQQQVIDQPVFGLYLVHNASAAGAGGEIALGGWNTKRMSGDITWMDVVTPSQQAQQGFWAAAVDEVQLAWPNSSTTTARGTCSSGSDSKQGSCIAMLDSGTAQILGSLDQVAALNKALGGTPAQQLSFDCQATASQVLQATVDTLDGPAASAGANAVCSSLYPGDGLQAMVCSAVQLELFLATQQAGEPGVPSEASLARAQDQSTALCELLPYVNVTFPCGGAQQLPNVTFVLGGNPFSVSSRDYAFQNPSDMQCYSGITALGSLYPGSWVLGDAFLHNYYTIFDFGKAAGSPRVGIAALSAAEQAAQAALFNQAVASKSRAGGSEPRAWMRLLLMLFLCACLIVTG